jgi:hypothetical protein
MGGPILSDMMDQPLDWLKEQPAGLALLSEYARQEAACPPRPRPAEPAAPVEPSGESADEEESTGNWIPRLTIVEGVEPAAMPSLHGKLIALGMLKFEFFAKSGGMKYRLSPLGRQMISGRAGTETADASPAPESGVAEPVAA